MQKCPSGSADLWDASWLWVSYRAHGMHGRAEVSSCRSDPLPKSHQAPALPPAAGAGRRMVIMLWLQWAAGGSSGPGGALPPASAKITSFPDSFSTFHTSLLLGHPSPGWGSLETKSRVSAGVLPGAVPAPTRPQ